MDWERVLINFGVVMGFLALTTFWVGIAIWLRVDAEKRGLPGWVWAFVGILTGPVGLITYILFRGNRPVLEIVKKRDQLIAETRQAHAPIDYDPPPAEIQKTPAKDQALQAALEAEERGFRRD
ncbi:MAG TPA: hypothetical protein VH186_13670 [Chloroflexia bacterium]|nr:hypothetical protein [Chloroflexia bacterium]